MKTITDEVMGFLRKLHPVVLTLSGLILVFLLGVIDYLTGSEIAFSIFYLAPILLVTAFAGAGYGYLLSVISAVVWLAADELTGRQYLSPAIPIWNMCIRLGFYYVIVLAVSGLKAKSEQLTRYSRHLEEMVKERVAELQAANKEQEQMSYSISRIMQQPLRSINEFCGTLSGVYADKLGDEGRRLLEGIHTKTLDVEDLLNSKIDYLNVKNAKMIKTDIDMGAIAGRVFKELSASAAGREIRFEAGAFPHVPGDPELLRRVWENLLSNAIKFTKHKKDARIEAGGAVEGNEIIYHVKDNGMGFDLKYMKKIFEPFEVVAQEDEFRGMGMGLAFVKRIVERHGGWVWAEARLGEGATFFFALPKNR